jgi:hypothetical protein
MALSHVNSIKNKAQKLGEKLRSDLRKRLLIHIYHGQYYIKASRALGSLLAHITGYLNSMSKSKKQINLCFCCSTLHVVCNIADPLLDKKNAIFFFTFYAGNLKGFIKKLGYSTYSASGFWPVMVIVSNIFKGNRLTIWIPHLSPVDFSFFAQALIHKLKRYQVVKYIDDGMAFASRDTLIYRKNYISVGEGIYSWDFTLNISMLGFPNTITRSYFDKAIDVVASSNPSLISEGLTQLRLASSNKTGKQIKIILASKLLDEETCMKDVREDDIQSYCYYIPHYNGIKNSKRFSLEFPLLRLSMPEFGMLGIAGSVSCKIYFGVTATAIFFTELLIRSRYSKPVDLCFVGKENCETIYMSEVKYFRKVLTLYQSHPALEEKGIRILFK